MIDLLLTLVRLCLFLDRRYEKISITSQPPRPPPPPPLGAQPYKNLVFPDSYHGIPKDFNKGREREYLLFPPPFPPKCAHSAQPSGVVWLRDLPKGKSAMSYIRQYTYTRFSHTWREIR